MRDVGEAEGLLIDDDRGLVPGLDDGDMDGDMDGEVMDVDDGLEVLLLPEELEPLLDVPTVAEGDGELVDPVDPVRLVSSLQAPAIKARAINPAAAI